MYFFSNLNTSFERKNKKVKRHSEIEQKRMVNSINLYIFCELNI